MSDDASVESRDGGEWRLARAQALRRDQYRCQHCDRREGKWGTDLHVHHIQPTRKGGSHELENLVTLCNSCHNRLHGRYGDEDKLPPKLLEEDRATLGFTDTRIDRSELSDCANEIIDILQSRGPTQLKDIVERSEYSRGYINTEIQRIKSLNYVCRVSRGVYAYVTTLEYRRLLEQDADEYGRRQVSVWNPGVQQDLGEYIDNWTSDDPREES
ncbi:HNH endonuclease [Haloarcula sebkhae]|uniref:HNH endonuclease n=2 Tax=Haloarcula sebkhae TaxID=932660 RepID=A0ACC6VIR6_9EURY|nr:hypothetical protein GCM10009067_28280 [Haloarcula sebkhae]